MEALQFKYWADTIFEDMMGNAAELRKHFEKEYQFEMNGPFRFTGYEAYKLLNGEAVHKEAKGKMQTMVFRMDMGGDGAGRPALKGVAKIEEKLQLQGRIKGNDLGL
jgi:hypothetical protein